jgi:anti-sigma-K factor RskA
MSTHISDDLPRLLTGEASRDEVLAAATHLRNCPDCQQELVSAVVAHASLSSAQRFAPGVIASRTSALPDLEAVFASARDEVAHRPALRRRRVVALVAAAAVATGVGVTLAETLGGSSSPAARTVALDAFGGGRHDATARVTPDGSMRIDATSLPHLDGKHFYEVWLTDGARKRMQAVGAINDANRAQLTISPQVMSQYSAIEVSVQGVRQTGYSGTSVLRGSYG